jgi:hypothetical protein
VRGLLAQATSTPPGGLAATALAIPNPTGHLAYPGTHPVQRPPRSTASKVALTVLAVVVVAGLFAGGFFTHVGLQPDSGERPANMDATISYGEGGTLPELGWDSYQGGCLNGRLEQGQRITAAAQVDCGEPHDIQFYDLETPLPIPEEYEEFPNADYPDAGELAAYAERTCTLMFNSKWVTGDKQALRYRAVIPSEKGWVSNRSIHCVLERADGKQLTESHAG